MRVVTFQFRIILQDRPLTRRGILSTVSSVYDPLGFLAPVILTGRQILQSLCRDKSDWDDPVPLFTATKMGKMEKRPTPSGAIENSAEFQAIWVRKHSVLRAASPFRCERQRLWSIFLPTSRRQQWPSPLYLHHGQGAARMTPLKPVTIPRLELTAALLSVKVSAMLREELEYDHITEVFYTDRQVVLGYIKNDARRFHVFVANRVEQIRENSTPDQWRYINTKETPADEASHSITPHDLLHNSCWLNGSRFLWDKELPHEREEQMNFNISSDDPEVKKAHVLTIGAKPERMATIAERLEYFSDWNRAKRAISVCMKLKSLLQSYSREPSHEARKTNEEEKELLFQPTSVEELRQAERVIIKSVQEEAFSEEIKILQSLEVRDDVTTRDIARKRNSSIKK